MKSEKYNGCFFNVTYKDYSHEYEYGAASFLADVNASGRAA